MATLNLISKMDSTAECPAASNMYTKNFISKIKERNIDVNSIHPVG
jgi:hypothetical protein